MRKLVGFLTFVLVAVGAFASVSLLDANRDGIGLKHHTFFVKQLETLPFDVVCDGNVTSEVAKEFAIVPSNVAMVTDSGFYGSQVGQCTVSHATASFTLFVKEELDFLPASYTFLPITGLVGDTVALFQEAPTNLAYTIQSNSLFTANAANGTLTLLKPGTGTVTLFFQTEIGTIVRRQVGINVGANTFASSIIAEQALLVNLEYGFMLPYSIAPHSYNQVITFTSSNPTVATVEVDGFITPLSIGSTIITIRAKSATATWLEREVALHVYQPMETFTVALTDEADTPFESVLLAPNQMSHSLYLQVHLPYSPGNVVLDISSDAQGLQTAILLAEGQTRKYALSVQSTSNYTLTITVRQTWSNAPNTVLSQAKTVLVQPAQEAFSALLAPYQDGLPATNIVLHCEPSFSEQPACAKASLQVTQNFSRTLSMQPLSSLITLDGNTITAIGIGEAQLRVYDPLGALPDQILTITIHELFNGTLNAQPIALTVYGDAPFAPFAISLPQTRSQSHTSISLQSKHGLFIMENDLLLGQAEGNDSLCYYVGSLLVLEVPVVLTRIPLAIWVKNMFEEETNDNLASVAVNVDNEISLLVRIETTIIGTLAFNLSILNPDGTPTTYASHGLTYGGADPREYNRISLIPKKATIFLLRIFVQEYPHVYNDVLITVS